MADKQIIDTTRCAWKSLEGTYCPEVEQLLKLKEQELEQYKKSKQASYEALQKECNELELGIRKLQKQFGIEILYCKATGESTFRSTEILKLKRTLTEIKEIAYELTNEEYTDFIEEKQKQILNKISEVIENE